MNVHTVELGQPLGPNMIRRFCRLQRWFRFPQRDKMNRSCRSITDFVRAAGDTASASPDQLTSCMYPADGIQKVTLVRNPSQLGYFYLVVVVNLEALYRQATTVESFSSFTSERLQRCSQEFERIMAEYSGIRLRALVEWSVRRVDYAIDLRYPNLVPLYVSLMKQGRIPRGMEMRRSYEGSYYLESPNEDVTINFYDKAAQLRHERTLCNNDRLLLEAEGLLRLEVQCQGRKLNHLCDLVRRRSLPYYGRTIRTFLHEELANTVVQDYFYRALGYQDYYTFQAAMTKLERQRGRKDMKQRIVHFLQQVRMTGSVSAAIAAYRKGIMPDGITAIISGPESSLQNILHEYLPRYGLNPVLLPEEWNGGMLQNPMPENLQIYRPTALRAS
ncbi:hypothetical protein KL86SPO_50357 [uncultured Sporomusa sp.]|uniref:Uncharacterized protein n=2 Tax=uncultured Sporomusa sp. TaxID=307249 RepID=A0A212LYJ6_9FIRM|nr:hypothetical protein KL86SPO_50357 [uncultured Sporomusa sp.]